MKKNISILASSLFLLFLFSCKSADQRALERAEAGIEKYRKGEAVVRVMSGGLPVEGANVRAELIRHDFRFGSNLHLFGRLGSPEEERTYREKFSGLFNYATIGLYWGSFESDQGRWDHARLGSILDWCDEQGIEVKAHALIYLTGAGIPSWSKKIPDDSQRREYVRRIMTEYKDRLHIWEIVNEPAHHEGIPFAPLHEIAREVDPGAFLVVNDFGYYEDLERMRKFFRDQEEYKGLYDAIGIQAHAPERTWFRPARWTEVLDAMAAFGKPLHITEFFLPSDGSTVEGLPGDRKWDEETQAEAAVEFYKLCFGHPAVEAIGWWDLCDRNAWREATGLLRADLTEKKAYRFLYELINKTWHTSADGRTGADGAWVFRGFSGVYMISVETPDGRTKEEKFNLEARKKVERILDFQ